MFPSDIRHAGIARAVANLGDDASMALKWKLWRPGGIGQLKTTRQRL